MKSNFYFPLAALTIGIWMGSFAAEPEAATTSISSADGGKDIEQVIERGPNHELHQRITETVENGETIRTTNQWTLVQPGISYLDGNGVWTAATDQIDLAEGGGAGAEYRRGAFHVKFPADQASGPLEITLPDGRLIKIQTVGIALTDPDSGDSIWLSEIKGSAGLLVNGNMVVYPDAFAGMSGEIHIEVGVGTLRSDVLIKSRPIDLAAAGFGPNSRIEVWHRIIEGPAPEMQTRALQRSDGGTDLDQELRWGEMMMGRGAAFLVGTNVAEGTRRDAPAAKEYFTDAESQSRYLIESVKFSEAATELGRLPEKQEARVDWKRVRSGGERIVASEGKKRQKPRSVAMDESKKTKPAGVAKKVASIERVSGKFEEGYLMDYTLLTTTTNEFRFAGNSNFYVQSAVVLGGKVVIEAGTVVKFYPVTNQAPSITISGPVECLTTPTAPGVFTADVDSSVGDVLKTGTPSGFYGATQLLFNSTNNIALHDLRMRYANTAISFQGSGSNSISGLQAIYCNRVIEGSSNTITARNILANNVTNVFSGTNVTIIAEQVTAHLGGQIFSFSGTGSLSLTNSLLVGLTGTSTNVTQVNCVSLASDSGVFEKVLAGAHYLPAGSAYRGTALPVSSATTMALAETTTMSPLILTNTYTTATTLRPRVARGTLNASIGYQYPAVDYLANSLTVSNATLILTNGVSIAGYSAKAIRLLGSGSLVSQGEPLRLNKLTLYYAVQEQPERWITNLTAMIDGYAVTLKRTDIAFMAGSSKNALLPGSYYNGTYTVTDSILRNATVSVWGAASGYSPYLVVKNNVLARCSLMWMQGYDVNTGFLDLTAKNNLVYRSTMSLLHRGNSYGLWAFTDNFIDNTTTSLTENDPYTGSFGYNGFSSSSATLGGANNKTSITATYDNGPLGPFYYAASGGQTNLIDAGSLTNAALAGLFQYATQTNSIEWNTRLDIGAHFPATGADGKLMDSDGDGISNWVEDANLNGVVDSGETSFADADTDGDGVFDGLEIQNKTDPLNRGTGQLQWLEGWAFVSTNLYSDRLQAPTINSGIVPTKAVTGYAVPFTNAPAKLQYAEVSAGTHFNITRDRGTVQFWFKPVWATSSTTNVFASTNLGQIVSMGAPSAAKSNWWSLHFTSLGDAVVLETEANGSSRSNVVGQIYLTETNWQQFTVVYDTNYCRLYRNGFLAIGSSTNTPLTPAYFSRAATKVCFGSDLNGQGICQGWLDEVRTWNYPFVEAEAQARYPGDVSLDDADGDGVPTMVELQNGTDPENADSDGDGLPDGWERKYGLNPSSASDANGDPDHDGIPNWQEFILGMNPNVADELPPDSLENMAASSADLINFNFSASTNAIVGWAAAGYATNRSLPWIHSDDKWNQIPLNWDKGNYLKSANGVVTASQLQISVNLGVSFLNTLACNTGQLPYSFDPFAGLTSSSNLLTCTKIYDTSKPTPPDSSMDAIGTNCYNVAYGSDAGMYSAFDTLDSRVWAGLIRQGIASGQPRDAYYYVGWGWVRAWYSNYDLSGTMADVGGVSTNGMFKSYIDSAMDTALSGIFPYRFSCMELDFTRDGHTEMHIGALPGSWYRIYLYAANPNDPLSTELKVNGASVAVPNGGYSETNFVRGVNYERVTVPLDNGYLHLHLGQTQSLINGMQIMQLHQLPAIATNGFGTNAISVAFSEERGAVIRWKPVPTAIRYDVLRTNLTTHTVTYLDFAGNAFGGSNALPYSPNYVFEDSKPPRQNTVAYYVRAVSEVSEYTGPWTVSPTNYFPALNTNEFHHAPTLFGSAVIGDAFVNTPFLIRHQDLVSGTGAADQDGDVVRFQITKVISGKVKKRMAGGFAMDVSTNLLAFPQLQIGPGTAFYWEPPRGVYGKSVPAFEVSATDGEFVSGVRCTVSVLVKGPNYLTWWGDSSDGVAGNGLAGTETFTEAQLMSGVPPPTRWWETQPSPVQVDPRFVGFGAKPYLTNIVQVEGAHKIHAALRADGTVWTWGAWYGNMGMLGDGIRHYPPNAQSADIPWFNLEASRAIQVTNLTDVCSIAVNVLHCVAVKLDGTVWGWGDNEYGQLGTANTPPHAEKKYDNRNNDPNDDLDGRLVRSGSPEPVQIPGLYGIVSAAADGTSTLAVSEAGKVYFLGDWRVKYVDSRGNSGDLSIESTSTPIVKNVPGKVIQVATFADCFFALNLAGEVYAWGNNQGGNLGVSTGTADYTVTPTRIPGLGFVTWISGTLAVQSDGTVMQWGGLGSKPKQVPGLHSIKRAYGAYGGTYFAVDRDGTLWGWGWNGPGLLGRDPQFDSVRSIIPDWVDTAIPILDSEGVGAVSVNNPYAFAVLSSDQFGPRGLTATSKDSEVDLAWSPYAAAKSYEVQRSLLEFSEVSYRTIATVAGRGLLDGAVYIDRAVTNGATYFYRVRANLENNGLTDWSKTARGEPSVPPGSVAGLTLSATNRMISVAWSRMLSARGYEVYRKVNSGSFELSAVVHDGGIYTNDVDRSRFVYRDYDVAPGQSNYYMVRATNVVGIGPFSSIGGPIVCSNNLPALTGLTLTTDTNWTIPIVLTWDAPGGGWSGWYNTRVFGVYGTNVGALPYLEISTFTNAVSISYLPPGATYIFEVMALNEWGQSAPATTNWHYTNFVGEVPPISMSIVSSGNATNAGGNFIYARWTGAARQYLSRPLVTGGFECPAGYTSKPDEFGVGEAILTGLSGATNALVIDQIYDDSSGVGSITNAVSFTNVITQTLPPIVAIPGDKKVILSWYGTTDQQGTNEQFFKDWRFIVTRHQVGDNSAYCPGYLNVYDTAKSTKWAMSILDDPSNPIPVQNGSDYFYRVYGISPTNTVLLQTMTNAVTPAVTFPLDTTSLVLTTTGLNGGVRLSWTNLANANAGYTVTRSSTTGGDKGWVADVAAGVTTYDDWPLENGKKYYYVLIAKNVNEDTFASLEAVGAPVESGALFAPTGFTASFANLRLFTDWKAVPGADYYAIVGTNTLFKTVTTPEFACNFASSISEYRFTVEAHRRGLGATQAITIEPIWWTLNTNASQYLVGVVSGGATNTIATVTENHYENVRLGDYSSMLTYAITPLSNGVALASVAGVARGANDLATNAIAGAAISIVGISTNSGSPTVILSPTNYVLRASVTGSQPASRVEFYSDGIFVGSAVTSKEKPYEFEWVNPPGGIGGVTHALQACLVAPNRGALWSVTNYLSVAIQPDLSAFTTSATDLQFPAPGMPLALARFYDSRDSSSGLLGMGWKLDWERSYVQMADPSPGWTRIPVKTSDVGAFIETQPHLIEVTVGGGREVFHPQQIWDSHHPSYSTVENTDTGDDPSPGYYFEMQFAPLLESVSGSLSGESDTERVFTRAMVGAYGEDNSLVFPGNLDTYRCDNLTYSTIDGSAYQFATTTSALGDRRFELQSMADRFTNSVTLTKNSGATTFASATNITFLHSNGRKIYLEKVGNTWNVYDSAEMALAVGSRVPVLEYVVTNSLLTEVRQIRDRATASYDSTYFTYDGSNRLVSVANSDGVVLLSNGYDGNSFVNKQTDAIGLESNLSFTMTNTLAYLQVTQNVVGGVTNLAAFGPGGEVASVQADVTDAGTKSAIGYNEQGLPAYQLKADGSYSSFEYDPIGRPVATVDGEGNTTRMEYDPWTGGPAAVTDGLLHRTSYSYYSDWNALAPSSDPNVETDPVGTLASVVDGSGLTTLYTYNTLGQVLSESKWAQEGGSPLVTLYQYATNGDLLRTMQLAALSGTNGAYVTNLFSYDLNGNRLSETRVRHVIARDGSGAAILDGSSQPTLTNQTVTTLFKYDGRNRLLLTTNALGEVSGSLFGSNGKVLQSTNTLGQVTTNLYDVRGNLLQTSYPDGTVSRSVYDERGRLTWSQERATPDGSSVTVAPATETQYDTLGRAHLVYRHENTQLQKIVLASTDPTNSITPGAYYRKLSTVTGVTQYTMSLTATGVVASITRTDYDSAGRVKYSVNALGGGTAFAYDLNGRRTATTNYLAYTLTNIATDIINPGTNSFAVSKVGFDGNGNQIWAVDGNGNQTDFDYDLANRRWKTVFPLISGESERKAKWTEYDGFGQRVVEHDEVDTRTGFAYDLLGRLTTVTNDMKSSYSTLDLPLVTSYAYDEFGNMTNQVRTQFEVALGGSFVEDTDYRRVTWFEYDALGRRTHRFLPVIPANLDDMTSNAALERTVYSRMTNGGTVTLRKTVRDFRGLTITNDFDVMDRLVTKTLPLVNSGEVLRTVSYYYSGPLMTMLRENGSGIARTNYYAYDDSRRLKRKDTPEGVLSYSYRTNSAVATMQGFLRSRVPVNTDITTNVASINVAYGYDGLGRLASITNSTASNVVTRYTYDLSGNLQKTAYPHAWITNTFDARNRLTRVEIDKDDTTLLRKFDYSVGSTGLRRSVTESTLSGGSPIQRRKVNYNYDSPVVDKDSVTRVLPKVSRLTDENIIEGSGSSVTGVQTNLFDPFGNRRGLTVSSIANVSGQDFEYNVRDQEDSGYGYTFDANGNTTGSPNSTTDYYDTENNLVKRVVGTSTNLMVYDAEGHRVMRHYQTNSTHKTIYFLWDDKAPTGYPQVVLEAQDTASSPSPSNATQYETFEWGRCLVSLQYTGTNYYVGLDGHGSTRLLITSAGSQLSGSDFDYEANGVRINSPTTTLDVHYLFSGYEWDATLGMDHMGPRFYDPVTGRFWTRDSYEGNTEHPVSLHQYAYCVGDPLNLLDPSGHDGSESAIGQTGVAGITGIGNSLVLPALSAGRMAALNKLVQVATAATAEAIARTIVNNWMSSARAKFQKLNPNSVVPKIVPIPEPLMPTVAAHIEWHQSMNPSHIILQRAPVGTAYLRRAAIMSAQAVTLGRQPGLSALDQLSWDEYPFASSTQGGQYGVTIWPVPLYENALQGGVIIGSYILQRIQPDDLFAVVVVP